MAPTGGADAGGAGGNVKVVVRVRPFNNREFDRNAKCIVQMQDDQTVLSPPHDEDRKSKAGKAIFEGQKTFKFDKSYWSFNKSDPHFAAQENLFDDLGVPLLDNAFEGYNNCIFAYGQTGSGKSYSMMGYGEDAGVIPRICRDMFERIGKLQGDPHLTCTVEVSYLEIYNERVRDLLNPTTKGNLRVREHPSTGPYVEDLAKLAVRSFAEIDNLMDEGNKARTVAATNMNETSSRSHAVFTLTLTQKRHDVETSMDSEKVAKISLVDLAGSERQTSTGATGARLKEGAEINRSLSTLGRVIATLADLSSGKKNLKVPYRDSVLTWLLKDSLGGNSLTAMIATISPADINFEETLSTLRYADSAKRIKNHAVVNEDPNARMIRELKEELARLRSQLGSGGAGLGVETYPPDTPLDKQYVSIMQADGSTKQVSKSEIMDQLSQSEKLYKDLNQTWEEKLQVTEKIHKEREAALEELGISIEKGNVGMSTPKKMPHLVNLSEDPLLAGCLVYNLKPGLTTVGNAEGDASPEIRLNGSRILTLHCRLENVDNNVSIIPTEGAQVMVNGVRVDEPRKLKSGNRIILGDFHIFRFNNPLEPKSDKTEPSLLRHSVTAGQLNSPIPFRPSHERTPSKFSEYDGESSRAESPMPHGRDSDWLFARREAAGAILGADPRMTQMTDEQLDQLFEDIGRAREERRGRSGNRLDEADDESDDLNSFLVRDKYLNHGMGDNYSLDTALTAPATPPVPDGPESAPDLASKTLRTEHQQMSNEQNEESGAITSSAKEAEELELKQQEKQREQAQKELERAKMEFQEELKKQKEAYEAQLRQMSPQPYAEGLGFLLHFPPLSMQEKSVARIAVEKWQQRNNIRLAEHVLQHAGLLKEAQVMAKILEQEVFFQFVVLDVREERPSSYDLILHDISEDDDPALADARRPCLAVRMIDMNHSCIHFWSLEKLRDRLGKMRQMHQYKDQPEYLQHFKLGNPFTDSDQQLYSLVGDGSIPLTAVFETRVQDFSTELLSPSTRQVVGRVRLSLEPSLAEAPMGTFKFNVILRDLAGFSEHEGTDAHLQIFVTGTTDESVVTSQTVNNFGEGPIRFDSIHPLSVSQGSQNSSVLRIALFTHATTTHLDKLTSWDEIRELMDQPDGQLQTHRLPETEYAQQERHDVFAKAQILEVTEDGQYYPVEAIQPSTMDNAVFQLHQGLQRRISVSLTHCLRESLPWDDLINLRIGEVHLVDSSGRIADIGTTTADINLKMMQEPMIKDNPDGTSNITISGQWDSSLHKSLLLDRATNEQSRIQVSLKWDVQSSRLEQPMTFSMVLQLQNLPRSYLRPQSVLKSFWNQARVTRSTEAVFAITVRPASATRAEDLWRLDTSRNYVNGEELLGQWRPRGIALIKDYIQARRRRRQIRDIESLKGSLGLKRLNVTSRLRSRTPSPSNPAPRQEQLMRKYVSLWQKPDSTMQNSIFGNTTKTEKNEKRSRSTSPTKKQRAKVRYVATVLNVEKNPVSLKSGYLLMPCETHVSTHMAWKRRWVDLRAPYLHIHSVPDGDAINAVNLSHARVDHDPDFKRLLAGTTHVTEEETPRKGHKRSGSELHGLTHIFAVYGEQNTFLFAARNQTTKDEWILAIDRAFSGAGDEEDV